MAQGDHLKLQRGAATNAKREERDDGGKKGDHRQTWYDDIAENLRYLRHLWVFEWAQDYVCILSVLSDLRTVAKASKKRWRPSAAWIFHINLDRHRSALSKTRRQEDLASVKNHARQVDIGRSCGQYWGSIHGGLPVVGVRALVRFQPGGPSAGESGEGIMLR
jgi:hypothetical protein